MSLTDEIYRELSDGLENNLDWQQFLAKHSASKGPLYNAIGLFFTEVGPKIAALKEEGSQVQSELDQAGLTLDQLYQQIKETEASLAPLEEEKNALNEGIETLEVKLAEKSELIKHAEELGKLGFNSERLRQLRETLADIGAKSGFKGREAVSKFFTELKNYDTKTGFEREIQRLGTIVATKKLEAAKWQAETDSLSRRHKDLSEAIAAVQSLIKHGVKVEHIVSWNGIVSKLGGSEELEKELGNYKTIRDLLNVRKEETKGYELRLTKAQSQVETLEKEKNTIGGAIDALKVAGVKELKVMTEEVTKQLKTLANREINEIRGVGQEVRKEFSGLFTRFDTLAEKVFEVGQEYENTRQELRKYEGLKDVLESHAAASEAEDEFPEQS
ncbi:Chromosome partition protein Smc [subsurface metagenome]